MSCSFPFPTDRYLLVGTVTRAHGLKGELKVACLYGEAKAFINNYSRLALVAEDGRMTKPLKLVNARIQGRQIILKLDTIDTKNEADLTMGMGVLALIEDIQQAGENSIFSPELIGSTVLLEGSGTTIGTVESCFDNGGQTILVIHDDNTEYLVPAVEEIIIRKDRNQIFIDPPPGLLDINRNHKKDSG